MAWTKEQLKMLKEKGVDDAVILSLMFEDDPEPAKIEPQPAPAKEEPAKAEPQPSAAAPAPDLGADKILAAIEKLTGAVQAANIRNAAGTGPATETADDILARVINPKGE